MLSFSPPPGTHQDSTPPARPDCRRSPPDDPDRRPASSTPASAPAGPRSSAHSLRSHPAASPRSSETCASSPSRSPSPPALPGTPPDVASVAPTTLRVREHRALEAARPDPPGPSSSTLHGGSISARSEARDFTRFAISPWPCARMIVRCTTRLPAVRSRSAHVTPNASPSRSPVASMNRASSGRSCRRATSSPSSNASHRRTSSADSSRALRSRSCSKGVSSRTGFTPSASWRTSQPQTPDTPSASTSPWHSRALPAPPGRTIKARGADLAQPQRPPPPSASLGVDSRPRKFVRTASVGLAKYGDWTRIGHRRSGHSRYAEL